MNEIVKIPESAWEFHGHRCPFMPIGYRMGIKGMRELGMERIKDHGAFAFSEMGVGHPQTCMIDGVMSATGCTYGKLMMERLSHGKVATIIYMPGKGAARLYLKNEFQDELGTQEFFSWRKKGVEPSDVPPDVVERAVQVVLQASDEKMFKVEMLPDFKFSRPKGSFAKVKCSSCGEYVFERYVRTKDGKPICIPCSGFTETRVRVLDGIQ
ncbi:MAG TPA: FmdE family protein [Methanomassiliicoccales archaeon]|nr:FmdE family protein [Methanomassiliicoccales archaeon]